MKIARILYPVHVLGPGERVAIWTYGCEHACRGCANPELWETNNVTETNAEHLKELLGQLLKKGPIEGVTITGGDPFYDPESLKEILEIAEEYTEDILVYTGYLLEELHGIKDIQDILGRIAVLIDGTYDEKQNNGHVLKGSDNQNIYYLKKQYQSEYGAYMRLNQGKYLIENFPAKNGVISVGIHKPDFMRKYKICGGIKDRNE